MTHARFTLEAGTLSKALTVLAAIAPRRGSVACLACVHIEAAGDRVCITSTDLDSFATIALNATVETAGRVLLEAHCLDDSVKAAARQRGALATFTAGDDGKVEFACGRTRLTFLDKGADGFPARALDADASETWEAFASDAVDVRGDGLELSKPAAKALAKLLKRAAPDDVATFARFEREGRATLIRVQAADFELTAELNAPALFTKAPRDAYTFGYDGGAAFTAESYLRALKASLQLPDVDGNAGRLVIHNGRAIGLEVGASTENRWNYAPEGTPVPYGPKDEHGRVIVDGVAYAHSWSGAGRYGSHLSFMRLDVPNGARFYPVGAYSLPLPASERRAVAALTVDVDGDSLPLRHKANAHGGTLEIELNAAAVADLCGPVEPSTFVEIEPLAFKHGRIIARGKAAAAYNRALECQRKAMRKQSDRVKLAAYCADPSGYSDAIGSLVILEETPAAPAIEAAPCPALEPVAIAAPAIEEPAGLVDLVDVDGSAINAALEPAALEPAADDVDAVDLETIEEPAPAAPAIEAPAAAVEIQPAPAVDLAARLERLERLLGLEPAAPACKRSPAHAAAIRRAWSNRTAARRLVYSLKVEQTQSARERARLLDAVRVETMRAEYSERGAQTAVAAAEKNAADWQAIATANAAHVDKARADLVAATDRIRRLEAIGLEADAKAAAAFKEEGAALEGRIDALTRENVRLALESAHVALDAMDRGAAKSRLARRAAAMRVDLARTRSARDGLAGNLAALTARAAADAKALEAMRDGRTVDGEPRRFILATR